MERQVVPYPFSLYRQSRTYSDKKFFNSFAFLFLTGLFVLLQSANAANYYWRGNGGNWSDLTHWASSSGGAGSAYATPPTAADNVFFDANSITAASQTITFNVNPTCANFNLTGVLNYPTFAGASTITFYCSGSWTWASAALTYAGKVEFNGTGSHTITTTGVIFNSWVTINSTGGTYTVQDYLYVDYNNTDGILRLQSGTLNTNSKPVYCNILNCNIVDNVRALNLGTSSVNVYGTGTAIDFRGNTTNFTLTSSPTSQIYLNGTSATIQVGTIAKTIPKITANAITGTLQITSGTVANTTERITFGDIVTSGTAGSLRIDAGSVNTNQKTFGNITSSKYVSISGANGTTWGSADRMIFTGNVNVGSFDIYGNFAEVQGNFTQNQPAATPAAASPVVTAGTTSYFRNKIKLLGNFTVGVGPDLGATAPRGSIITSAVDTIQILGNIYVSNSPGIMYGARDGYTFNVEKKATISGGVIVATNCISAITTTLTSNTVIINGTINTGVGSAFGLGGSTNVATGIFAVDSMIVQKNSSITILPSNAPGTSTTINELVVATASTFQFGTTGTDTTAIGRVTYTGSCNGWSVFKSISSGTAAKVKFTNGPTFAYVMAKDLNITSANLTINSGMDQGNNTGITFNAPEAAKTFYWVGGLAANTKTGTYSTGVNNNWSNPDNWSLVSGVYSATNECAPGPLDNVRFDASSFTSASNKTCDVDQMYTYVNDFDCTGATAGSFLDNGIVGATNTYGFKRYIYVSGNITLAANMTNNFEGTFYFNAGSAKTITSNGAQFYGPMVFDNTAGDWTLADNLNINCQSFYGYYADFTVQTGIVRANAVTINLEGDFTVSNSGSFLSGTGSVIFDATNSQNPLDQTITTSAATTFYNLTVLRTNGTAFSSWVKQNNAITINNNFLITSGFHYDNGYQITGNGTGTMTMSAGSYLYIGRSNSIATIFPTNFVYANITLDPTSTVYFGANATQTVSGLPDYGNLVLIRAVPGVAATGTTMMTKTLTEPVLVNTSIYIAVYNNFYDGGFQISFDAVGPNAITMQATTSQLTLGSAGSVTTFPVNYTPASVNFGHPSYVVYNAGADQTIEGLFGTTPANYSHLTLTNSPAAAATKSLNANTIIRGNLLIDPSNVMDVTASNYSITLAGNWTDKGTFTERLGMVTFNGTALQTININNNVETFYDVTFNNTVVPTDAAGSISIVDDIVIAHSATFTDGVVCATTASPADELVTFNDDATTSGASNNSFVNGRVRKIGNEAFVFPTGNNVSKYAPIGITAPSLTTDHFTARYFDNSPNAQGYTRTLKDTTLDHVSSAEYWILDRTNGTSDITPSLYWDSPRSGGVATLSLLRVAKWDGTKWKDLGFLNTTGTTTSGNLQTSAVVTSFSPFTLATDSSGGFYENPLPIELINFTAKAVDNKYTQLEWTTSTETNNDYFTVERSRDGIHNFEQVATVKGAGNSSKLLTYSTQDLNPLNGLSYYRLKQTDFDGKYTYSRLESVVFSDLQEAFYIFPNPATPDNPAQLHPTTSENVEVLVVVYDISGKQYFSKIVITQNSGENVFALDLNQTLAKGVYYIIATTNDTIYKKKLVIQ
ncbi:MAG: T9SS type A sorting domain-containing protein [Bacteroidetes bacterium]|nr:T9SS type A sorting domain-containing protein [Bacteroidota bacterium]